MFSHHFREAVDLAEVEHVVEYAAHGRVERLGPGGLARIRRSPGVRALGGEPLGRLGDVVGHGAGETMVRGVEPGEAPRALGVDRLHACEPGQHRPPPGAPRGPGIFEPGGRVVGQLADEREHLAQSPEPVVRAGPRPDHRGGVGTEALGQIVVGRIDAEEPVDRGGQLAQVGDLRLPTVEGERLARDELVKGAKERGPLVRSVKVHPAEARVVQ